MSLPYVFCAHLAEMGYNYILRPNIQPIFQGILCAWVLRHAHWIWNEFDARVIHRMCIFLNVVALTNMF